MTNHLHWTTLNADARHFDSRLQKEQHDAAMPVMYFLYPLNLSSIVQVQVCQSLASNRPNVGYLSKKLSCSPWDHGFFSSRFTEDVSGAEHLAQRQDRKPLCKSHAFNIIQLQLGSSDKIWFKVTRGDQNASLKVVQSNDYKLYTCIYIYINACAFTILMWLSVFV